MKPVLIAVASDSVDPGWHVFRFSWKKPLYGDHYLVQASDDSTFAYVYTYTSTWVTVTTLSGFPDGRTTGGFKLAM